MGAANRKIGILGGSFDPIHKGHLHLANEMMRAHHLDEVWFVPAQINPLKIDSKPRSVENRIEMVRLAIEGNPSFKVLDIEAKRQGPSYTIDTLKELKQQFPSNQFYLLIGEDAIATLPEWKQINDVIKLSTLIIGARKHPKSQTSLENFREVQQAVERGFTPMELNDISSTEIRNRLKNNLDCREFLPTEVFDYIQQNMLYFKNL